MKQKGSNMRQNKLNQTTETSPATFGMRIERCFITMRDGVRLAATLYTPDGATEDARFPSLLELLPYRKDDGTFLEDRKRYKYFSERGYVGVRVDVRGTGASEGIADDEYTVQEGQDALEIIEWLANQSWSNGRVGMWGLSYGGFNAIQVAMLRPEALKAIVAVGATDDVYTDDIVYWNGALEFESMGRWPPSMIAMNGLPGYPDYDIDSQAAKDRFEHEPWVFHWLRAQRDGPYWRRMSLRPRYDAINIPAMLIGGWLDGYPDSIPRMVQHMKAPVKGIIGPWPHAWPNEVTPGPQLDSNFEILRWWDYWLKDLNSGVTDEPPLALYIQRYYPPGVDVELIPGQWRFEEEWPIKRVVEEQWFPQPEGKLANTLAEGFTCGFEDHPTTGTASRYRLPHNPAELSGDQRLDDAFSLSFTSPPLKHELEILGTPRATLYITSSAPVSNWIVRVCDIAPDGSSQLVTKAVLNGTHRDSHANPEPMVPGQICKLQLDLKVMSWVFSEGHMIRLAISNADFPNIWPGPDLTKMTLHITPQYPSQIALPVCPFEERPTPAFREPDAASPDDERRPDPVNAWKIIRDEMGKTTTVFRETKAPPYRIRRTEGQPVELYTEERRWCTTSDINPARSTLAAEAEHGVRDGDDTIVVRAQLNIESDKLAFHVKAKRELIKNGGIVRSKSWEESIPRDHL